MSAPDDETPQWLLCAVDDVKRILAVAATGKLPPGENPDVAARLVAPVDPMEDDPVRPSTRIRCAIELLDRVEGRPTQRIAAKVDTRSVSVTMTRRFKRPAEKDVTPAVAAAATTTTKTTAKAHPSAPAPAPAPEPAVIPAAPSVVSSILASIGIGNG